MADFIKIPRALLDSPIIKNAEALRLFVWLYANANGNGQIQFNSGDAHKLFSLSRQQYRGALNVLCKTGVATTASTTNTTTITIYNCVNCGVKSKPKQPPKQPPRQPPATNNTSSNTLTLQPEYPFVDPMFEEAFSTWLEYKEKQWKFKYKTERSLKSAYAELVRMSGGDPCRAMQIVEQSMRNGWKGLFELKEQYGTAKPITPAIAAKERRDRVLSLATTIVSQSENLFNLYNGCGEIPEHCENQK